MKNLLFDKVDYKVEETAFGTWRRFMYPSGACFAEFRSHRVVLGLPLFHFTNGICPETGRRVVATGIVAVGRLAVGGLAIGQASAGLLAIGQLAVGLLFGLGQASTGAVALGQLALGFLFGLGQVTTGLVAVGQFGLGKYVLAQRGFGGYVWSQQMADPEAVQFFKSLPQLFFGPGTGTSYPWE